MCGLAQIESNLFLSLKSGFLIAIFHCTQSATEISQLFTVFIQYLLSVLCTSFFHTSSTTHILNLFVFDPLYTGKAKISSASVAAAPAAGAAAPAAAAKVEAKKEEPKEEEEADLGFSLFD